MNRNTKRFPPVPTMARAKWQQLTRFAPKPSNEGLLERQLGRNSILDTVPETNSIVASRITLLNETGHSHSRVKNRVSTRVAITFVMWNAIEVFTLGINKERKKR